MHLGISVPAGRRMRFFTYHLHRENGERKHSSELQPKFCNLNMFILAK